MIKGHVLILGAKSDIAMAIAHRFAKAGHPIQLAARDAQSLETARTDIAVRYDVAASVHNFDALAVDSHAKFARELDPLPQIVICAVGYMGEQSENESNTQEAVTVMRSNYEGPASILGVFANHFEERRSGVLVGISSVAGSTCSCILQSATSWGSNSMSFSFPKWRTSRNTRCPSCC